MFFFCKQKLEEFVSAGLIKSIGISNFNQKQIQRILDNCTIRPACLQIELHIYFQQHELVDFCKANNIAVVAYAPLGSAGIAEIFKSAGNAYVYKLLIIYDLESFIFIILYFNKICKGVN